jgi:hypothetical protein
MFSFFLTGAARPERRTHNFGALRNPRRPRSWSERLAILPLEGNGSSPQYAKWIKGHIRPSACRRRFVVMDD